MANYTREFPYANVSHIYVHELYEALRREILYDPDFALDEDEGFYSKVQKDPEIARLIRYRGQLVSGNQKEWACEPITDSAIDRQAATVMAVLMEQIKGFQSSRYNLSMSFLKGNTWAAARWEKRFVNLPGYGKQLLACVTRLRDIDKRRMDRRRVPTEKGGYFDSDWKWHLATGIDEGGPIWKQIDTKKYIHHVYHDDEASVGHGRGIAAPLFFLQWWSSEAMRNGMQFLNRWSQGLIVYSIDCLTRAGVGVTAAERGGDALALIDRVRAGQNIVVPNVDDVKVIDAPVGGWSTSLEALNYIDEMKSRLILGSVLPTGGGTDKGSLARAEVEDTAMARLIGFDRGVLGESITDQLVAQLWRVNWPIFKMLGLGKANMPRFVLRQEETLDGAELVERLQGLVSAAPELKKRIKVSEIMEQAGLTEAGPNDETLDTLARGEAADETGNIPPELLEIVKGVAAGEIPGPSAMAILSLFPGITQEQATAMIAPAAQKGAEAAAQAQQAPPQMIGGPPVAAKPPQAGEEEMAAPEGANYALGLPA